MPNPYQERTEAVIHAAENGDAAAEEVLRRTLEKSARSAPRHHLVKIMRFINNDLRPDMDIEVALRN